MLQCAGCGALIHPLHAESCACVPGVRRHFVFCPECWGRHIPPRYRVIPLRTRAEVTVWDFPAVGAPSRRPKRHT